MEEITTMMRSAWKPPSDPVYDFNVEDGVLAIYSQMRDEYMAASIWNAAVKYPGKNVVVVVGASHAAGKYAKLFDTF
jgi:hypothetical protein